MSAPDVARRSLRIPAGGAVLDADVGIPEAPRGVVLFAHGSGSGRHSPRNRHVADVLSHAGMVSVLADLLTADEEQVDLRTRTLRFDIGLLAQRVTGLVDWVAVNEPYAGLGVGLFGASTGAAAALIAAADRPAVVQTIVSRGGRPDLAGARLHEVRRPTLLIVGGRDTHVLELTRMVMPGFGGTARLVVVPDATHLFEEPGALEQVARLARDWFLRHLVPEARDGNG